MRHWKELQCLNIGDDYEDLSFFKVGTFFQPDKDGYYTYDKNADWAKDLQMDDRIYYPTIRQFRVSVCTSLYRQQIPLHYIRKHMNHLSEDMAAYYIRPQKNLEKEYSETIYRAVFKDGSRMLGTNGDAFVQKINEFIEQNHMNIQDDMEGVIQAVAKKFPLRSKVGGMYIRCGEVIPCASNNSTDVIYCAFGMCPNHCHMFFMADAIQEIRNNKISINRVAKESGIARQTFYNNPIITAYIEAYIAANTSASPYETIETLREEIRRKDEQIAGLVQRDATVSKCRAENLELTDEIASLRETIKSQEELIRQLRGNPNVLQTKRR